MGRRPRVADVSDAMRHEALTYGRAAAARPAGDGVGAAEEGTHVRTHGEAQPPRQPAGHYGEWPNWANVLEQPPASLAGGALGPAGLGRRARLHGKTQSGQKASLMAHLGPGRDTIRLPVVG